MQFCFGGWSDCYPTYDDQADDLGILFSFPGNYQKQIFSL
jgi:hypothetical protein